MYKEVKVIFSIPALAVVIPLVWYKLVVKVVDKSTTAYHVLK